jgi:DHA1 family tetracycline resistance protein-like MFS transporter
MQFIAAPLLGELSDVYGRKRLLTLGVGLLAVSQMVFGYGIVIASVPLLFISRMVAGLAGANFSIAQASIADVTEPKDRAKNFGLIGAAFGLGFIIGPVLGGYVAHATGNASAPFFLAGILGICNLLSISLFLPETHTVRSTIQKKFSLLLGVRNIMSAFRDVDARPIFGASFLYQSGFAFFTSFVGVLLVGRYGFSEASIGTFFGAVGICIVFTQIVILRYLTTCYSERSILRVSLLALAIVLALYPFAPNLYLLYILIPIVAVANGLSMANMGALISKGVSKEKQGAALGINGSLMALAQGIAPLVAGIGTGIVGLKAPFLAGAFLVSVAWLILVRLRA